MSMILEIEAEKAYKSNLSGLEGLFSTESIKTIDDLKKQYHQLSKIYHPDVGGSTIKMQELNNEYEELSKKILSNSGLNPEERLNEEQINTLYREIIESIISIPDINIEIVGKWIWVSGNTYPVKGDLKEAGFFFASKKKMWFWRPEDSKSRSRKEMSIEEIRAKYGSKDVKSNYVKQLSGLSLKQKFEALQVLVSQRQNSLGATEVLQQSASITDGYNANGKPLDFNGFHPTYEILNDYSAFFETKPLSDIRKGDGFKNTLETIKEAARISIQQAKQIAKHLFDSDPKQFAFNIWHWIATNIKYEFDPSGKEYIRTILRTWSDRNIGVDCEDMATAALSIIKAIGFDDTDFNLVAFNHNKGYQHIYSLFKGIVIDGVMTTFGIHPENITKNKTMGITGIQNILMDGNIGGLSGQVHYPEMVSRFAELSAKQEKGAITRDERKALNKMAYVLSFNSIEGIEDASELMLYVDDITPDNVKFYNNSLNMAFNNEINGLGSIEGIVDDEDLDELFDIGEILEELGQEPALFGIDGKKERKERKRRRKEKRRKRAEARKKRKAEKKAIRKKYKGKERRKAMKKWRKENGRGLIRKVWQGIKKFNPVSVAARNAFLALISLNFRGYATLFVQDKTGRAKLEKFWQKIGGSKKSLHKAIGRGKKKKALLGKNKKLRGIEGLGELGELSIPALLTSAGAIIAAIGKFFKANKADIKDDEGNSSEVDLWDVDDSEDGGGFDDGDDKDPDKKKNSKTLWFIGAGVLGVTVLYLILK